MIEIDRPQVAVSTSGDVTTFIFSNGATAQTPERQRWALVNTHTMPPGRESENPTEAVLDDFTDDPATAKTWLPLVASHSGITSYPNGDDDVEFRRDYYLFEWSDEAGTYVETDKVA